MKKIMWTGLLLAGLAGKVEATEIQLTGGSLFMPDESFGLVSDSSELGSSGLRLVKPIVMPGLSATIGYELGNTSTSAYSYGSEDWESGTSTEPWYMDEPSAYPDFSLHTASVGVRYQKDLLGWLSPYVGIGVRAAAARLSYEDNVTGWTMPDPEDPTGEEVLYTAEATSDIGKSIGAEAHVGLAIRIPLGSAGKAAKKALSEEPPTTPAEAAAAPAETTPPEVTTPPGESRPPRFYWGGFVEGGYQVATDLTFKESGSLEMGGSVARFGLLLQF